MPGIGSMPPGNGPDAGGAVARRDRERQSRAVRDRARLYQARQSFHAAQSRRRVRDDIVAGVAGALLVAGLVAVQTAYFTAGPGAPEPEPTGSPAPSGTP